jgi:outer membrane protein insertion porin family
MKRAFSICTTLILFCSILSAAEVRIVGVDKKNLRLYENQLKPRLQYILARPATSWRADDAAFYLKRIVLRRGYSQADVKWSISGNTIILKVQSGLRLFYGAVLSQTETSLDQETLTNYFYQPIIVGELVGLNNAPYIEEYTERGASNVENYLKSKGNWLASVTVAREYIDIATGRIHVLLDINKGRRHTLIRPKFIGISSATEQEIVNKFSDLIGKPSSTKNIVKINSDVTNYFRRNGYHFAEINVNTEHRDNRTTLSFQIQQGKRYMLRDVAASGHQDTQTRRILRVFKPMKNKVYDADAADKATNRLLNTGIFKKVVVTPKPHDDGFLDIDIELEEGESITTRAYIGTDSYEGLVLGVTYSDLNLSGKMWQFSSRAEYTGRGLLGEVGITEPFFAGEDISFNLRGFALKRRPDGYEKYEFGTEAAWTWQANDKYSLRGYLGSSYVNTSSTSMTKEELGPIDYLNTRIGVIQSLDLRNNPILPNAGYNGELLTELGSIIGDADTSYFKIDLNNSYRKKLHEKTYIISSFDVGAIVPANSDKLPIDMRLFSGGTNSVRSFEERGLGRRSGSGDPLGGESYWVGSAELVREIKKPFHLALFYDLGQVYSDYGDLDFSNASHAVGLSARIHLPIGPVRFEYGYNLNRRDKEPQGTFHFTIGASF